MVLGLNFAIKNEINMKKIIFLLLLFTTTFHSLNSCENSFYTNFSAGYVFKHDTDFKEVYGSGLANLITADFCYSRCGKWGIGTKVSYWRAHGKTTFLKQRTTLKEIPLTFYLRAIKDICSLQMYASLGGGIVWIKEKSYLGERKIHKGVGEAEIGLNYMVRECFNLTSALRYLFPAQRVCKKNVCDHKIDIGGLDLRLGIGFSF